MKELEEQLAEIVKKAVEVAEKTGEFAIEQAPLLLQEFYMWHIVQALLCIGIGIIILFISKSIRDLIGRKSIFTYVKDKGYSCEREVSAEKIGEKYYHSNEYYIISIVIKYIALGIFTTIFFIHLYTILFIIIAPKLYLIEYFIK